MKNLSRDGRIVSRLQTCLALLLSAFSVSGQELLTTGHPDEYATHCSAFIPPDAVPAANLTLCTSSHGGQAEVYACQNMHAGADRYRIYFKGGQRAKAIARLNGRNQAIQLIWQEQSSTPAPVCHLQPPAQFSAGARFMGAGVCEDTNDQPIPCSVFRVQAPRMKTFTDYMIFYRADGKGPGNSRRIYTGVNQDAMPAELMYQIGLSLIKTRCCRQRGLQYIEQASRLFPTSTLYRATYQHYKVELHKHGEFFGSK
jgi:hypothetical protein